MFRDINQNKKILLLFTFLFLLFFTNHNLVGVDAQPQIYYVEAQDVLRVTCDNSQTSYKFLVAYGPGFQNYEKIYLALGRQATYHKRFPSLGTYRFYCYDVTQAPHYIKHLINYGTFHLTSSATSPTPSPTPTMGAVDLKITDQNSVPYTYSNNVRIYISGQSTGNVNMRYSPSSSTGYMRIALETGKAYDITMTYDTSTTTRKLPFIGSRIVEKVTYQLPRPVDD